MPIKAWEDLTITDDYMFKLVMRNKRICTKMLEMILNVPIRNIKYLEEEKSMKFRYSGKGIRLDVYVEDDQNTVYDVEMQVKDYGDTSLARRTRYYQSMIDMDFLDTGADYEDLNEAIIIFICPFAVFDGERHLYTFENICKENKELPLNDGTKKIFLSTRGNLDDVSPEVANFLKFMDGIHVESGFVTELKKTINKVRENEEERKSYMDYARKLRDMRKEGKEEGLAEGRLTSAVKTIKRYIKRNLPLTGETIADIADDNDLTVDKVRELAKKEGLSLP